MAEQALYASPEILEEYLQRWSSLLHDSSEQFFKEGQKPNDRLNILIEFRDKLNESLAEATRQALTAQNENALISRLPSEIFLHICELACPRTTPRPVFEVITLTHVCRRWRDVILSYPTIWSHIYVWRNCPESLVTTLLQRSQGVPLTVNIHYTSDRSLLFGCGCAHHFGWEDGDRCPHRVWRVPSLGFLEPFRANVRTLNVRYLRNGNFDDGGAMADILKTPFFFGSFPNLESLRWSCLYLGIVDMMYPLFKLPRKLFGSSLPRLRKLSMVNCWGLVLTDTPVLEVMSVEFIGGTNQAEISANHLVNSLRHRQSLVSLSLTNCNIVPETKGTPDPVSMKKLKEIILRKVGGGIVSRYIRCPSIRKITTLRIAPFTQAVWADDWTVSVTAADDLGGSVSTLVHLYNDAPLTTIWELFAHVFRHSVTALEVEDLHLIVHGVTAIPKLMDILPNLCTIRVRLPPVAKGFEVLREIVSGRHDITRIERLVCEMESPDEARRNDEKWKALCIEHRLHDFLP